MDAITKAKATTIEGLKVEARALSWCCSGDFRGLAAATTIAWWDDERHAWIKDDPTTDSLVADSILFDLIAFAVIGLEAQS